MTSRFLFNRTLWDELGKRIGKAKTVRAAVAYVGTKGADLLPLRDGHTLVVDMSLGAVKSGATDPREIKRFLNRGVAVFSRRSLHAKFFVMDKVVLAGSSNISRHSRDSLDEAAIVTDDPAAVARAAAAFDILCTEPVRKEYLAKCLKEYRPPAPFIGPNGPSAPGRTTQAKVWVIGGLHAYEPPAEEQTALEVLVKEARKKLRDHEHAEVDCLYYPETQAYFAQLHEGDWLVSCLRSGTHIDVYPPARFMGVKSYPRGNGRRRYVVFTEYPTSGERVYWPRFRRTIRSKVPSLDRDRPRTQPISDSEQADAVLRLWDRMGRLAKTGWSR